jgi:hypothetical protein
MRGRNLISSLAVVSVLTIAAVPGALAQTKAQAPARPSASSSFDKLSLGNQKVAAALYQAQSSGVAAMLANGATPASKPLSLEEIAAKRRGGQAWGPIFREMKAKGLVHDKSLGQVVARYQQTLDAAPGMVASDNGGGKSHALDVNSNGYAGGAAQGFGKGGK